MKNLTAEQQNIIKHPTGKHARVLAVAGSGKTTTMVYRIEYLAKEMKVNPSAIMVVMFNRLAKQQFEEKLLSILPVEGESVKVYTFHGLAFKLWNDAVKGNYAQIVKNMWTGSKEELSRICMHRVITEFQKNYPAKKEVESEDALMAVGLWKASLIPPERAGHKQNSDFAILYNRYEQLRREQNAMTFDDFIPEAMGVIKKNKNFSKRWSNRIQYLIVDEYQDINYGQEQLIKLIAGEKADIMIVGDDDQTIYEWRAARPSYILKDYKHDFSSKEFIDYKLSHSFRFGPIVARAASNIVNINSRREEKQVVSNNLKKETNITVFIEDDVKEENITNEIRSLLYAGVKPSEIGILGRTFAQLEDLQAVFIDKKIPFTVLGMDPFFSRSENTSLLDYVRVAIAWDKLPEEMESFGGRKKNYEKLTEGTKTFCNILNKPSRKISRSFVQNLIERANYEKITLCEAVKDILSRLPNFQKEEFRDLFFFINSIKECIKENFKAGRMLQFIYDGIDYEKHFSNYYGTGNASVERINSVKNFINFASMANMNITDFMNYLKNIDTTRGAKEEEILTMTTIHRTKGMEYDYVFIPNCIEGHMPVCLPDEVEIYDKDGIIPQITPSLPIENERRLFYVAITRAKKHVYISTKDIQFGKEKIKKSRFLKEMGNFFEFQNEEELKVG